MQYGPVRIIGFIACIMACSGSLLVFCAA